MKSQSLRGMFPPICDGTHLSGVCTSLSQLHLPLTPQHCRNLVINLFFILFSESPPVPMTSATNLLRIFSGQNPATDLFPDTRLTFPALPGIFPSSPMDVSKSTRSNWIHSLSFPSHLHPPCSPRQRPPGGPWTLLPYHHSRPVGCQDLFLPPPRVSQLPLFYLRCIDQGPSTKQPTQMGLIEHRFIKRPFTPNHGLPLGNRGLKAWEGEVTK